MKPITERHVQAIWYDAALRPKNLTTRRGSEVRVVSPGAWNLVLYSETDRPDGISVCAVTIWGETV